MLRVHRGGLIFQGGSTFNSSLAVNYGPSVRILGGVQIKRYRPSLSAMILGAHFPGLKLHTMTLCPSADMCRTWRNKRLVLYLQEASKQNGCTWRLVVAYEVFSPELIDITLTIYFQGYRSRIPPAETWMALPL